jgi:hypothetical protein
MESNEIEIQEPEVVSEGEHKAVLANIAGPEIWINKQGEKIPRIELEFAILDERSKTGALFTVTQAIYNPQKIGGETKWSEVRKALDPTGKCLARNAAGKPVVKIGQLIGCNCRLSIKHAEPKAGYTVGFPQVASILGPKPGASQEPIPRDFIPKADRKASREEREAQRLANDAKQARAAYASPDADFDAAEAMTEKPSASEATAERMRKRLGMAKVAPGGAGKKAS